MAAIGAGNASMLKYRGATLSQARSALYRTMSLAV